MPVQRDWKLNQVDEVRNCEVEVKDFAGQAKVMIMLELNVAQALMERAVRHRQTNVQISFDGNNYDAEAIDVRANTIDPVTGNTLTKPGQPGVCTFSKMRWVP